MRDEEGDDRRETLAVVDLTSPPPEVERTMWEAVGSISSLTRVSE